MRHTTATVWGQFNKPVRMYRGETMAGNIADESYLNTSRGFVGGYNMQTIALGPSFFGAFVAPGGWGPEFTRYLDSYLNTAGMWIVGEDMPQATNRVTLKESVTDSYGLPVAAATRRAIRRVFHPVATSPCMPPIRREALGWYGALSRLRWPGRLMSGSRAMAAALTPRVMPGRCLMSLRASPAQCRYSIRPREPGACWRSTWIRPALAATFMTVLDSTIMNVTPTSRPRSALRLGPSPAW
ncbi:MAG: hypothetical protein ACRDNT_11515 [Streptosporangiaceae bacterium]